MSSFARWIDPPRDLRSSSHAPIPFWCSGFLKWKFRKFTTAPCRFAPPLAKPGERTKIAVQSRDKDVDPVGACVGMKGMRVQSIIRELRGEKIDIIPYSEDTVTFAQKALSPAKVTRVQIIDPETRHLEIIVEDTQLSLAIGKKGQNVRLASKLIGWNVDIKSEEEKRQEIEAQMAALTAPGTPLSELKGVGPKTIERIETHGVTTIEKLADMTPEQLTEIPGIGEKMVEKIQLSVAAYFQSLENPHRGNGIGGGPGGARGGGRCRGRGGSCRGSRRSRGRCRRRDRSSVRKPKKLPPARNRARAESGNSDPKNLRERRKTRARSSPGGQ